MAEDVRLRRFARIPTNVEIRARDVEAPMSGEILFDASDISEGGAFLRSQYLLEVGDRLEIRFQIPETKRVLYLNARVAWATRDDALKGGAGMGLEFIGVSEDEQKAISAFVRSHGVVQFTMQTS